MILVRFMDAALLYFWMAIGYLAIGMSSREDKQFNAVKSGK
jgi:hypothetical protein